MILTLIYTIKGIALNKVLKVLMWSLFVKKL